MVASRPSPRRPSAVALTLAGAAAAATAYLVHRVGKRSGVTNEEMNAVLPGDELVTQPMWGSTRAITIDAPVEEVWPWIVQMGFPTHRAGWYTRYVLDRLTFGIRERSASQIRPELQRIEVGDEIPDSADGSVFFAVVGSSHLAHLSFLDAARDRADPHDRVQLGIRAAQARQTKRSPLDQSAHELHAALGPPLLGPSSARLISSTSSRCFTGSSAARKASAKPCRRGDSHLLLGCRWSGNEDCRAS